MNPLEKEINSLISEIEIGLLKGHISSRTIELCLELTTKVGVYISMCIGMLEKLDTLSAEYFINNRPDNKSDLATTKKWKKTSEGIRQQFWDTRIDRLKTLESILDKNYYHGKMEYQRQLPSQTT